MAVERVFGLFPGVFDADGATVAVTFGFAQVVLIACICVNIAVFADSALNAQADFSPSGGVFFAHSVLPNADCFRV